MIKTNSTQNKPSGTIELIDVLIQRCGEITRDRYRDQLIGEGIEKSMAQAMTDEHQDLFTALFECLNTQAYKLFNIVELESEINTTKADLDRVGNEICQLYMHSILDYSNFENSPESDGLHIAKPEIFYYAVPGDGGDVSLFGGPSEAMRDKLLADAQKDFPDAYAVSAAEVAEVAKAKEKMTAAVAKAKQKK